MKKRVYKYEWVVYGLTDQQGGIRYVGKTGNISKRLSGHLSDSKHRIYSKVCFWIRGLVKKGLKPGIILLEKFESEKLALEGEVRWMIELRKKGSSLLNHSDGGEPCFSGRLTPDEVKKKISRVLLAKKMKRSPEHIAILRRKRDPEICKKISEGLMGHPVSKENADKSSERERRFSKEQVIVVRKLRDSGWTYQKIADKYGVNPVTVFNVIKRKGRCYES